MSKFIASFSGGKDSILAVYRAIRLGMEPLALVISVNEEDNRSWFHGLPNYVIEELELSLGIPIWRIKTNSSNYREKMIEALRDGKDIGASYCIFGDIDLIEHYRWCFDISFESKITPFFPLWGENREKLVYEFIDRGFKGLIKVVDTKRMNKSFLGKVLDRDLVEKIKGEGVDICGEEGEFHTFTYDGPLFKRKVEFNLGDKIWYDSYYIATFRKE